MSLPKRALPVLLLALMLLTSGPYWKLVLAAKGKAVWYSHSQTSIDEEINPYARSFVALQGDWDRQPYPVVVRVNGRVASASRRDVTRSKYAAELSPKLCNELGLDFGQQDGIFYGKWQIEVFEVRRQ